MAKLPKLPNGLTYKQEQFAREVASGSSLIDAYKLSYDAAAMQNRTISSNAFKLVSQPKIQERIEELEEQKLYAERLSDEFVLSEIIKNHYRAVENDELGHSNRALELLGRNLNLWKEQPSTNDQVAGLFAWLANDAGVEPPLIAVEGSIIVEKEEENQVKEEEKEE